VSRSKKAPGTVGVKPSAAPVWKNKKRLYEKTLAWFGEHMPVADSELHYRNPYELIVAVILSAQCTDKRVNIVTPAFFERFPTPQTLSVAPVESIYEHIRSVSYPNSKAAHLKGMADMLVRDFHAEVPSDVEQLQRLPGVGRKTANVVASVIFNRPVIAVDTHVFRVANRIGLVDATTPLATEKQLTRYIPSDLRPIAHHWLILHGRYVCTARKPKCETCGLQACCRYFNEEVQINKGCISNCRNDVRRL
jgi:endonuclease-3